MSSHPKLSLSEQLASTPLTEDDILLFGNENLTSTDRDFRRSKSADDKDNSGSDSDGKADFDDRRVPVPESGQQPFQTFDNQAAGHSTIFTVGSDRIAKPCNPNENTIYEAIQKESIIKPWTAQYFGTMTMHTTDNVLVRRFQKAGECKLTYLNLTAPFKKACVMDIKLGYKGWVEGVTPKEKVKARKLKGTLSGAVDYGFRISGIRVYIPNDSTYFVRDQKSKIGHRIGRARFIQNIELFLFDGVRIRTDVLQPFIRKLDGLKSALEKQKSINFEASSLLLIYEGDPIVSRESEPHVDLRLIDFDHAQVRQGPVEPANDNVAVKSALSSLLSLLMRISRLTSHSQSMSDLLSQKAGTRSLSPSTFPTTKAPSHSRLKSGERSDNALSKSGDAVLSGADHVDPAPIVSLNATHPPGGQHEHEHHHHHHHEHHHHASEGHHHHHHHHHRKLVRSNSIGTVPDELKPLDDHKSRAHGGHDYSPKPKNTDRNENGHHRKNGHRHGHHQARHSSYDSSKPSDIN